MLFYVTRRKCTPSNRTLGLTYTCLNCTCYHLLSDRTKYTRITPCYQYREATKAFVSYNFSRYEKRKERNTVASSRLQSSSSYHPLRFRSLETRGSVVGREVRARPTPIHTTRRIYATSMRIARLARQETSNRCSSRITVFHRFL